MTCAPRGIFSTKSDSVGRNAMNRDPRLDRKVVPSGAPIIVCVGDEARVRVELAAVGERDEVSPVLVVDEQHLVAYLEHSVHQRGARSRTGSAALARSASLQNAHRRSGVGAPQRSHGSSPSCSASASGTKRSDARLRKPK